MHFHRTSTLAGLLLILCPAGLSAAEDFSFESLCAKARKMAAAPHVESKLGLADFWKNLTYDEHRLIRFKMDSGLWAAEKGPFSIDYFHPGWTTKKTVAIHEVIGAKSAPLKFDQSLFTYEKLKVPGGTVPPPG